MKLTSTQQIIMSTSGASKHLTGEAYKHTADHYVNYIINKPKRLKDPRITKIKEEKIGVFTLRDDLDKKISDALVV